MYKLDSLQSSFDFEYKTVTYYCSLKKNTLDNSKKYQKNILKILNKNIEKNIGKVTVKYSIKNEEILEKK